MTNTNQAFPRPLACVTGASAGLGRQFAQQLAARGHDLLLVARDGDRLAAFAEELTRTYGVEAGAHVADLTRDEPTRGLAERLSKESRLAVLVNNAGFGTKGKFAERPVAEQASMLELHVMATMLLTRAALPGMIERRHGIVINVASVASFTASRGNANYCATKAYQRVFSEGVAMELAGTGVHIQALCPGFTHTEFHDRMKIDKTKGIPSWAWLEADRVVRESLDSAFAGGPTVCIPGKRYQLTVFALRHMPLWIRRKLQERYSKARL